MKWCKISKAKDCIMFRAEMKLAPPHPLQYLGKEIKKPNPILDWSRPFEIFVERKIWKKTGLEIWKWDSCTPFKGWGLVQLRSLGWPQLYDNIRFMMDVQDRSPKFLRLLALCGVLGSLENISPCFRITCLLLLIASLFSALFSLYHCSKYNLLRDLFGSSF